MEIIPILSTIILVATIATFILAIAAYVLYKIRERRARQGGVIRTDVVMHPEGHTLVTPQPALLGQPYAPNALPPMQPVNPTLALPAPGYAAMPQAAGPVAMDTNADGRYDTVYEPRPTYQNPVTGQATAYQPSAPLPAYGAPLPGMPGVQGLPGMVAAQPVAPMAPVAPPMGAPVAGRGSMFYEVTNQGLVPTPGATEQERARLAQIQRDQDRLEEAEAASKERLDTLRRQQDSPAWL